MSNVFIPKRIGQAADIRTAEFGFTGYQVLLENAAMNRHITFTQAQAPVNELNEKLARRAFGMSR